MSYPIDAIVRKALERRKARNTLTVNEDFEKQLKTYLDQFVSCKEDGPVIYLRAYAGSHISKNGENAYMIASYTGRMVRFRMNGVEASFVDLGSS